MCKRAKVGHPIAKRKDATATTGPTLQREPGSHHTVIVSAASRVTVRVPRLVGTCRVARVSGRRPRLMRGRVGGVDVITLPWSHMCARDEAGAAQAGLLREVVGWDFAGWGRCRCRSEHRRIPPVARSCGGCGNGSGLAGEGPVATAGSGSDRWVR